MAYYARPYRAVLIEDYFESYGLKQIKLPAQYSIFNPVESYLGRQFAVLSSSPKFL